MEIWEIIRKYVYSKSSYNFQHFQIVKEAIDLQIESLL